jgi:hypothetical protein
MTEHRILWAGVATVGLLVPLVGCTRPIPVPPTPTTAPAAAPGSYSYEIRGADGSTQRGVASEFHAMAGKASLEVRGGRVIANGKDYGPVRDGDSILLDRDGQLSVNGEPRQPR